MLTALTHFTITDDVAGVADIPHTESDKPFFSDALQELSVAKVSRIGECAFRDMTQMTFAHFPDVKYIALQGFYGCSKLAIAGFPQVEGLGTSAFQNCSSLATANFPHVQIAGVNALYRCSLLASADLPKAVDIHAAAFSGCNNLTTLPPGLLLRRKASPLPLKIALCCAISFL